MSQNFKIRIIQPGITHYRVGLYKGLQLNFGRNIELWAGSTVATGSSFVIPGIECDYSHEIRQFGALQWQEGLSLKGLSPGDVLVVCGDMHQLSSLAIVLLARIKKIAVVWWGHHRSASSNRIGEAIRVWFVRSFADVVLCYTKSGIEWYAQRGIARNRLFATHNTIAIDDVERAKKSITSDCLARFQEEWHLEGKNVILFCSSLRPKTRLDLLLYAMPKIIASVPSAVLVIIGDGPERIQVEALINKLGLKDKVILPGRILEQDKLAPWFMLADLFVYPGAVGLSLLHAFGYGLPAVLHDNPLHQMPEYEAFRDGINGLSFSEGSSSDLAIKITSILMNPQMRKAMSIAALKTIQEEYSMKNMVFEYSCAIFAAHKLILAQENK